MRQLFKQLKKQLYLGVASYFRFWANFSLKRWNPRVLAVTGSVGKTTMLHLLEIQLGRQAHYSHNANSAFGIAFDIVGLRGVTNSKLRWVWLGVIVPIRSLFFSHKEKFYVVEIDGERPKETEFLASWLRPEVTLWISLGRSHAVYFDKQVERGEFKNVEEAIAHEFAWLPQYTKNQVIIDGDNELLKNSVRNINAKVVAVSSDSLKKYSVLPNKTTFTMQSGTFNFKFPLPRATYVQLAMLEKLCQYLILEPVYDMSEFTLPPGRSNFFKGKKDTNLIDSTYNAHLISLESVLDMVSQMPVTNKWLVISDIVEQGRGEGEEHQKLGKILAGIKAEKYVLIGRRMKRYAAPVLQASKQADKTFVFEKTNDALKYIESALTGGETIVFKGSQYLEGIIEQLLENPDDAHLLPRREAVYKKRREAWGIET